ncbi:sulfurtransferase [Geobacter sp. FeAm09]|uniref:rhodanese-like domain-containing protein n=1 Tax=Geobacter sp. FeAm09 TaxID=2597769 RepID=UPI0011EC063F|nr:rhodanese-like domain-containing protein [Geobacter sp. FeAm09]QEM69317.1 sulfurtransferase [Geobacter sp. FeAm09]
MLQGFEVSAETVKAHMHDAVLPVFVNVRHHQDWDSGLFKARGALRIPDDEVERHLDEIPHDRTVVVYSSCPGDEASVRAAQVLRQHGWDDVHPLAGGFNAYLQAGLPVEGLGGNVPATKIMLL